MFDRIEKLSRFATLAVICILPFLIWSAVSIRTGSSDVHEWLPDHREERSIYNRFTKLFGDDQILLLTWSGCTLDDPRLAQMQLLLEDLNKTNTQPIFDSVETSASILRQLQDKPLELSRDVAQSKLHGFLLGRDGTACVLIKLNKAGVSNGEKTLSAVEHTIEKISNLERDKVYIAGTLFEEVMIDRASERSLKYLVPPSTICAILVAVVALQKLKASLLVFILAGLGQMIAVGVVYYSGGEFSAILVVLPTLVFMLTLSGAVHLVNYYRDCTTDKQRGVQTLFIGLKPTAFSAITTMTGMASLSVSDLSPVRAFGIYSAIALGIATAVMLAVFSTAADFFLGNSKVSEKHSSQSNQSNRYKSIAEFISRYATFISISSIMLLLVAGYGAIQISASTKFDRMFRPTDPTVVGLRWIEDHIGPTTALEVLVQFDGQQASLIEQVNQVAGLTNTIRSDSKFGSALSGTDFLPTITNRKGIRGAAIRGVYESKLRDRLDELHQQGWYAEDENGNPIWRITCKITALQQSYGYFVTNLRERIQEAFASQESTSTKPKRIDITGLSPLAHEAQTLLISDLGSSFLMAFVMITPVMMAIVRSVLKGLLLMLPNILPPTIVFGCAGWLGYEVDVASILTASVALGIAVDDTLHYVNWYMRSKQQGQSTLKAIEVAYQDCSTAMIETTLISCAAMLPFLFSSFIPTQNFSFLMIVMLSLALVGDLLLLPALLVAHQRFLKAT